MDAVTRECTARLMALPLVQRLGDPSAASPLIRRSLLRVLAVVHIEDSDARGSLLAELEGQGAALEPSLTLPLRLAREFAADLRGGRRSPYALSGVRYGLLLAQRSCGIHPPTAEVMERLRARAADDGQVEEFTRGLERSVAWFARVAAALVADGAPVQAYHVAGLNPEAGDHAMPQDPRDIALALRAGREAWDAFPYLAQRFGARGTRFTTSDSCWLVSLTEHSEAVVTRQLVWLRNVLATRGIPTIILERHLGAIVRALRAEDAPVAAAAPAERAGRYDTFLAQCEAERQRYGPALVRAIAEGEARLAGTVAGTVGRGVGRGTTTPDAAALVASAWLDERAGIPGAFAATRDWLVAPDRFSPEWIAGIAALGASLEALAAAEAAPC